MLFSYKTPQIICDKNQKPNLPENFNRLENLRFKHVCDCIYNVFCIFVQSKGFQIFKTMYLKFLYD